MTPDVFLDFMLHNQDHISARGLHEVLGIRQPYALWLARHVTQIQVFREPDDYYFVQAEDGRDCMLAPVLAIVVATSGGSEFAAKIQARYCRHLANVVFKDRNPIEVIQTGIKCVEADRLLERSFDPEP